MSFRESIWANRSRSGGRSSARLSIGRRSRASLFLTVSLFARPALAQTASTTTPSEATNFCDDHWFAIAGCLDRPWTGPEVLFGVDLGIAAMDESGPFGFGNGVGSVTSPGPAWGARVGVELFPWVAVEGRYAGMYNSAAASVSHGGGFLTSGVDAVLRVTAPLPLVHPYVFGGIGYYDVSLRGSAGSELHSSSQPGIPLGVGVDVPLTYHLSVGMEATYHFQLGEDYSALSAGDIDGGDLSTFDLVLRARL
jgi:hypothetical protein